MKDVQATREAYSPQTKHPALQNMKFLHFLNFCWSFFALLDPDLQHWNKVYAIEKVNAKTPAHARLLFDSHETSPIIWIDIRQARTSDTVLVKSSEMTGRSQTLPW